MKYKMMTATEAIDRLFALKTKTKTLDFTFDNIDEDPNCEPSGWYGMKLTKIFDEEDCVFVMGYYGGGSTEAFDIYGMVDNADDIECVKEFCAKKLQTYMDIWYDSSESCKKICVEIK